MSVKKNVVINEIETKNVHGGKLVNLIVSEAKERTSLKEKLFALPKIYLNPRQLCDLELLMNGGFSPLNGFLTEEDYTSVVAKQRLHNGILWPIPVVLDVDDPHQYKKGEQITLCDEYGKPLAEFTITSIYKPDKEKEAKHIYGTNSADHFGVRYLRNKTGSYYLGGTIRGFNMVDRFDFTSFRITPRQLRTWFTKHNWNVIIGFQTRNPIHKAHFSLMEQAAKLYNGKILLHPSVGTTKDGDIDYVTRVRIYIKIYKKYMKSFAKLSLLPLSMRMAGPKEALWHAIIRKNYGCTHFIIGRDHAGPGIVDGKPMYGPYEAQEFVSQYEKELGIVFVRFQEMVYVEKKHAYFPADQAPKGEKTLNISGTEFRKMLRDGQPIPEWFSFKETIDELRLGIAKERKDGVTIFLTGLPSSGKSTIARILYHKLIEIQDKKVTLLDGDVIRQNLSKGLGFTKEDRDTNIKRIGFVANEITKHGGIVICAAVSPYKEARQCNRDLISQHGTYIEVFINTPISVCKKRDVKGLYWKSKKGNISQLTGIDDPYETPENPEIVIKTVGKKPETCANAIVRYLKKNNLIQLSSKKISV